MYFYESLAKYTNCCFFFFFFLGGGGGDFSIRRDLWDYVGVYSINLTL